MLGGNQKSRELMADSEPARRAFETWISPRMCGPNPPGYLQSPNSSLIHMSLDVRCWSQGN